MKYLSETAVLQQGKLVIQPDLFDDNAQFTKALQAETIEDFRKILHQMPCDCCPIGRKCKTAPHHKTKETLEEELWSPVIDDGNPKAPIMFVGEAPGREEWLLKKPFIGASGTKILKKFLQDAKLHTNNDVYYANINKCWPFDVNEQGLIIDRPPTSKEAKTCIPLLYKQIYLVQPRVIVALGRVAAQALFETTKGTTVGELRGQPFYLKKIKLSFGNPIGLISFHPASCLASRDRNGRNSICLYQDILKLKTLVLEPDSIPHLQNQQQYFYSKSIVF